MRISPTAPPAAPVVRAPATTASPRPDYYRSWTGPWRRPRPYGRDLCVACACVCVVLFAAHSLGYV